MHGLSFSSSTRKLPRGLATILTAAGCVLAGLLLGSWFVMLCLGPSGLLAPVAGLLEADTLAQLAAMPGKAFGIVMLACGWALAIRVGQVAPGWRWGVAVAALAAGIPGVLGIVSAAGAAG